MDEVWFGGWELFVLFLGVVIYLLWKWSWGILLFDWRFVWVVEFGWFFWVSWMNGVILWMIGGVIICFWFYFSIIRMVVEIE